MSYWGYIWGDVIGLYQGYIRVILGLYWGYVRVIVGLYWGFIDTDVGGVPKNRSSLLRSPSNDDDNKNNFVFEGPLL